MHGVGNFEVTTKHDPVTVERVRITALIIWSIPAVFFMYEFFLRTFLGSVALQVIADLSLDMAQFSLLGAVYYLSYGVMQIPVGIIVDKFGPKKVLIAAPLVCALASFLLANTQGFAEALWARLFLGFGSSFAFVCLFIIIIDWLPRRYFGFFTGLSQFVGTMGPVLAGGPVIIFMGVFHIGWRSGLTAIGLFGIILSLLAFFFVKNRPHAVRQLSRRVEKSTNRESVMMRIKTLLRRKQVWIIALYSATVYAPLSTIAAILGTSYLQARGLSQAHAASMISLAWIGYAVGCPGFGYLSDITQKRKPYFILCAIIAFTSMLVILYAQVTSLWIYDVLFIMLGLGASGQNLGFPAIAEQTEPGIRGSAFGLSVSIIILLSALSPTLSGYLITMLSPSLDTSLVSPRVFVIGLSLLPLFCLIALVCSIFFCKETHCRFQFR
ncbi:MAG: MFS transporter [Francisellaceae bacterium]